MPPQTLLSPAGLHASSSFLSVSDRRAIRPPPHLRTRAPIRRTASTASVNDGPDNAPNDSHTFDPADISSDEEDQQEAGPSERRRSDDDEFAPVRRRRETSNTPPRHRRTTPSTREGRAMLLLDRDSPTLPPALKRNGHPPINAASRNGESSRKKKGRGSIGGSISRRAMDSSDGTETEPESEAEREREAERQRVEEQRKARDDASNNPFFVADRASEATTPKTRRAAKVDKGKQKVSYVFRGKRITYDAPIESLFPSDDEAYPPASEGPSKVKTGPRVLFPAPPPPTVEPTSSSSPPMLSPDRGSTASASARGKIDFSLFQTPRRQRVAPSSEYSLATPVSRPSAAIEAGNSEQQASHSKKKPAQDAGRLGGPFVPPTPASLPRVSTQTKEQKQLERDRFNAALTGVQRTAMAAHQAAMADGRAPPSASRSGSGAKRFMPYPPR